MNSDDLNETYVASDGAELESLVDGLEDGDGILLEPGTEYVVSKTLRWDQPRTGLMCLFYPIWEGTTIKPDGDFPAFDIDGSQLSSDWIGNIGMAGVYVDASNLSNTTSGWTVDAVRNWRLL